MPAFLVKVTAPDKQFSSVRSLLVVLSDLFHKQCKYLLIFRDYM